MKNSQTSRRSDVSFLRITTPAPWEAYLCPVSGFPFRGEEATRLLSLFERIRLSFDRDRRLNHEVFIQVEQFDNNDGRALFAANAKDWLPELGLGVWPDRDPPAAWTQEEFRSLSPGNRIRPLMFQVLQITTTAQAKRSAIEMLFPFGSLLEILSEGSSETLFEKTAEVFLPPIKDPSFTCFPYYIPLLEAKTLAGAEQQQLEEWFRGLTLYVRESFEDNGILIASREPLTPIVEQLGGRFEEKPEPHWEFPV